MNGWESVLHEGGEAETIVKKLARFNDLENVSFVSRRARYTPIWLSNNQEITRIQAFEKQQTRGAGWLNR